MTIYTYTPSHTHHLLLSTNPIILGKGASRGYYYTAKEAELLKQHISIMPENFVHVSGTVDALYINCLKKM